MSSRGSGDPVRAAAGFSTIGIVFGIPVVWMVFPGGSAFFLTLFMLAGYASLMKVASFFR